MRSSTAAEASSSVGATIAPSTKAIGQVSAEMQAWAMAATVRVVARTSPMAMSQICPEFARITSVGAVIASQ